MLCTGYNAPIYGDNTQKSRLLTIPLLPRASVCQSEEWVYTMRRTMQEVIPGLFLGPYSAAMKSKLDVLTHHGVTHIICVRQDIEAHFIRPNFPDIFKYLVLDIADSVIENIIQHFPKVRCFIDESLATGGKTLIHGNAGISRSAALAVAYVMQKYSLSYQDAFAQVQTRRFCINPNEGFVSQLNEYEPIYKAQQTLSKGQSSTERGLNKRRFDQVEETQTQAMKSFGVTMYLGDEMDVTSS